MSTTDAIGNEGTVGEEAYEQIEDDDGFEVIDEIAERERNLRPSVEAEIQATVDYADDRAFEGRLFGQTLAAEERMAAFEWEIERTRVRWDRRQDSDREARCRCAVTEVSARRRDEFFERAASVDRWQAPNEPDAREQLSQETLGRVNRGSARISERLNGWTRAAVSRLVAERTVETGNVTEAVLDTMATLEVDPGSVVPIDRIGAVQSREVNLEGVVTTLWTSSHPAIAQVGLLADETGRTKVTSWRKSEQPTFEVGDRLRIRDAAKSWYDGRWSIALTSRSRVEVVA